MVDVMEFAAIFSLGQSWAYMWATTWAAQCGHIYGQLELQALIFDCQQLE